jgi:hypothetical protein
MLGEHVPPAVVPPDMADDPEPRSDEGVDRQRDGYEFRRR